MCVCMYRPGVPGAPLPARAVLSMGGLSHGVIRVNTEDKNSALTVQDVGHVMPGGENPHYKRTMLLLSTFKLFSIYLKGFTSEAEYIKENTVTYTVLKVLWYLSKHGQIQTSMLVIHKHKSLSV